MAMSRCHRLTRGFETVALSSIVSLLFLGVAACSQPPAPEPQPLQPRALRDSQLLRDLAAKAQPLATDAALRGAFTPRKPNDWKPAANGERFRGGVEMYAAAAPAIVVVRTNDGHGTGFLVSADGLVITNHHVIESGMNQRSDASFAMVHQGALGADGLVQLQGEPVPAALYDDDPINDLALLKLERPAGAPPLPYIKLSATAPRPGQDCAIIGHPSSGMLWTFRPCQVASVGDFPRDMVNLVMARLSAAGAERAEIEALVKSQPPRKIMLTSAQANPGDSGGPVVDRSGALLGVTFGGPGDADEDKFTYHVHLDDVRRFTSKVPSVPMVLPPDPWNFGSRVVPSDINDDGKADVLVVVGQGPEVLLFDLDNDTPAELLKTPADLTRMINERRWDFEAAIDLRGSGYASFYDSDNTGGHDLVLATDEDSPTAKQRFARGADGKWRYQAAGAGEQIMSGSHFKDPQLGRTFEALLNAMKK
jgi:S1-C subfamily serine protease